MPFPERLRQHAVEVLQCQGGRRQRQANVAAADAAISTAQAVVIAAEASVDATGRVERIQADINDSTLKAPATVAYGTASPGPAR